MPIVPMERVTLVGLARDKAGVLDGLQGLGVVHLIPLRTPDPLAPEDRAERRRAETAFRHIAEAPEALRPYRAGTPYDAEAVTGRIMANRRRLRELRDRRDELAALVAGLAPWGDFELPAPGEIGGERLWLYALPVKEKAALARLDLPWQVVGKTPTEYLVVVIAPEEPPVSLLPVLRTPAGDRPLGALREALDDTEIAIEKAEMERAELTRWRVVLGADLAAAEDLDDLRAAAGQTLDAAEVFAVQGWAPAAARPALARFAEGRGLAFLAEAPAPGDLPPTLLEPGDERFAIGADLTRFYTSPGYRSWDPSLLVFVSFAAFFAMIVADAGYAALFALGTLAFWGRMGASATGRRGRVLLAGLSGAALVYGVLAGSYFGVAPPAGGVLDRLNVIDVTDFEKMMVVSILIGALHIAIALAMVAWLNRGRGKAVAALGWIAVLAGGLVLFLGEAGALGPGLLALGFAAVFWGAGMDRAITAPKDWLWRVGDGLIGLTGVTKLFGDILSYLRLFALGLASASLGGTFNQLAAGIMESYSGLGVLFAILVLIFGHAINIVIGIMSGVVHGLRLNYVEFFGWGLTEEGYPFRAFAKREHPA